MEEKPKDNNLRKIGTYNLKNPKKIDTHQKRNIQTNNVPT